MEDSAIERALRFLGTKLLFLGNVNAAVLFEQAKAIGISRRSIQRAGVILRVRSKRIGFGPGGKWIWSAPQDRLGKWAMTKTDLKNGILVRSAPQRSKHQFVGRF